MKRMYILGALLWLCSFVTYAQENLFDRFSEMEGVTSVYVSKAMFSMMSDIKVDGLQLEGIGQKLESLQVLNSEKAPVIQKLREAVTGFTPKHGYESLVRVRDDGEKVDILLKKHSNGINEFVVLADEPKEFTLIVITGRMSMQDIQNIIGEKKHK